MIIRHLLRLTTLLCLAQVSYLLYGHVGLQPSTNPAVHGHGAPSPSLRFVVRGTVAVRGRIDDILPLRGHGGFIALVGRDSPEARFLPHDDLLVVPSGGKRLGSVLRLPQYTTPPGLVSTPDGRRVYVVIDRTVWWLDSLNGRVKARWRLNFQALGWPAAAFADSTGRLYIAGQRWESTLPTAMVEAFDVNRSGLRVLWRSRLGTSHSGIWLGPMKQVRGGSHLLAAFLPNAADAGGAMALFSERSGALSATYAIGGPPSDADPSRGLLYLVLDGAIHALSLNHGAPVSSRSGSEPFALDATRGVVAFVHSGAITLAWGRTLHPITQIPIRGATALAFSAHGSTLLVGHPGGVTRVELGPFPAP